MLMYNVPGGKLNRGMAVYDTLAAIKDGTVEAELAFKANVLGWCIELVRGGEELLLGVASMLARVQRS